MTTNKLGGTVTGLREVVPAEDLMPGLIVAYCAKCGRALFADEGTKKTCVVKCRSCSAMNVFSASTQPRIDELSCVPDTLCDPIHRHNECQTDDLASHR